MQSLVYTSSATKIPSDTEITAYVESFRINNARLGVTGMLLHKDGCFVQLLEGEPHAVESLFHQICSDPRHCGVIVLLRREIKERYFPEWSMGYSNLNDPALRSLQGFSEFTDSPLQPSALQAEPNQAVKLLNIFRRNLGV